MTDKTIEDPDYHLDLALKYADIGRAVFPANPETKAPLVQSGFKAATTDIDTIKRWWTQYPNAMVAMCTGSSSGVIVLDIDVKDGANAFDRLHAFEKFTGCEFPKNVIVLTPSGGLHLYLGCDSQSTVRSGVRVLGQEGVDIRANGGYVIAAGSYNYMKKKYQILNYAKGDQND